MSTPATTQAALVASLLGSLGVPACEPFAIVPAGNEFVHERVTRFDPTDDAPGIAPHGPLSEHAARGPNPGEAGFDTLRRFLAPDVPANCGRFVEYPLYDDVGGRPTFGCAGGEEAMILDEDFPTLRQPPGRLVTQRVASRGLAVEADAMREPVGAGWIKAQVTFLRGVIDRERLAAHADALCGRGCACRARLGRRRRPRRRRAGRTRRADLARLAGGVWPRCVGAA